MNEPRLTALIFDCDGVLVDSEMLSSRVEAGIARDLGLSLTTEEAHDLFLGNTVEQVFEKFSGLAGRRLAAGFVYNWAFATAHAFMQELGPIAGIRDALTAFARDGHRMAVASQSPLARVQLSLQVAGLREPFGEHVYVTSMVARPKPAPDIYLFAAEQLGAPPADCVVIEDSPAGAAAARAAGFHTVGYAPAGTFDAMRAAGARVIRSMAELPEAVRGFSPPRR
ncbi:MAG: HAD family phosphatase [Steroidobacteraceae bacterium]|nr:HAD family phosphatase [Steroidobacteraceae bacterium]